MNLSPRELRIFVSLSHCLSFTEVADQFFVTQPTMSKLVSDIEEKLGVRLFERTTRNVKLTEEGRDLLSIATRVLDDYETGLTELEGAARRHTQQLSIAALPTLAARLLPRHITKLQAQISNLSIQIHDIYTDAALDLVRARKADLALVGLDVVHKDLRYIELISEPFVLLSCKQRLLNLTTEWSVAALGSLPLISMPRGTGTRRMSEAAFIEKGLQFRPVLEFYHLTSIAQFVRAGAGVALLPLSGAELILDRDLEITRLDGSPMRTVGVVTRFDYDLSTAAQLLINSIRYENIAECE